MGVLVARLNSRQTFITALYPCFCLLHSVEIATDKDNGHVVLSSHKVSCQVLDPGSPSRGIFSLETSGSGFSNARHVGAPLPPPDSCWLLLTCGSGGCFQQ